MSTSSVSTQSYSNSDLGISLEYPNGWDVEASTRDIEIDDGNYGGPRFYLEKEDTDLMDIVNDLEYQHGGSDFGAKEVLEVYMDDWEYDNSSRRLIKMGGIETKIVGNQDRAGIFVESHQIGIEKTDGTDIWQMDCWEIIKVGGDWWLAKWDGYPRLEIEDWEDNKSSLKAISSSLVFSGGSSR